MSEQAPTPSDAPTPAPAVETPQATPATPPRLTPAQNSQLRVLMDREAGIRQREANAQRLEQDFARRVDTEVQSRLKNDAISSLHQAGLSYEDLSKQVAEGARPDRLSPIEAELRQTQAQLQEFLDREETRRTETLWEEERNRVGSVLSTNEELKGVRAVGDAANDAVFQLMQQRHQQTGTWMSETEAGQEVEAGFRDLYQKLHAAFGDEQPTSAQPQAPTLSSSMTGERPSGQMQDQIRTIDDITGPAMTRKMLEIITQRRRNS